MTRTSFNSGWIVRPKVSPYAQLRGGQEEGEPVTLPHDAVISLPRAEGHAEGGRNGYFPGGVFEYVKTFEAPGDWLGKRVSVEFQGVYRDAMVFVNGTFAGQWRYGYSTFVIELDPYLRYDEANTIRVDARAHDDSRWYTGAGIHRDTALIVTDAVHVPGDGVRISTPDIDASRAVVEVSTLVRNAGMHTETVTVETRLTDPDGAEVARDSAPVTVRAGGSALVRQRLYVREPQRWSLDSPALHRARTILRDIADILEERDTVFGIRTLQVDPIHGLRINGESVKLRGACIHHDNGLLGAAAIGRAEERRIELLKEAGFNAVRSSHNPISQPMLDACDRLGVLVMDETFDMWAEGKSSFDYSLDFPEWWERDVEALVAKNYNHPSVVFYSIGNEILETGDPLGSEWGRKLAEKIRELDSTRLVTNGINGFVSVLRDVVAMMHARGASDSEGGVNGLMNSAADFMNQVSASPMVSEKTAESFSVLDVAGLNYGDGRYELDRTLFPNRVIVGSETFPTRIAEYWRLVEENPHVIGDFTWTGWDYLGEVGVGRVQYTDTPPAFEAPYPWVTAWTGDLDITGTRRTMSYYRETVFGLRHEPYIAVLRPENHGRSRMPGLWAWSDSLSTWSWNAPAGSPVEVEVYSDADEVELLINGESRGVQSAGRANAFLATFDVAYEPGEIVAVARTNGTETARTRLVSASDEGVRLIVTADRVQLRAEDTDLAYVTIELRDRAGTLVTHRDRRVAVAVEGAGILQALGSGRPDNAESYIGSHHSTFEGRLLAIVRPTGPGPITVTASADDCALVRIALGASSASATADAETVSA
ncbi:glycoside hydrolase family 2 protein [Microbacteriaceae bacterium VKM Ac-2855]|nr:glycoside hydrolase family 2 protein [Microbacteriaceae bacterium VKM Ac-2855]